MTLHSEGVRGDAAGGGGEGAGQGEHYPLGSGLLGGAPVLADQGLLRWLAHEARPGSGLVLQAGSTAARRADQHVGHQGHTLAGALPAVLADHATRRLPRPQLPRLSELYCIYY